MADTAETQFHTGLSEVFRRSGITRWKNSIKYMFRKYATAPTTYIVLEDICIVNQKADKKRWKIWKIWTN